MTYSNPDAQGRPQVPCEVMNQAILGAAEGEMPPFTTDEFLEQVGLGGDTPDGLPLLERFRGGEDSARTRLASHHLIENVVELVQSANERRTNPAEESVARTLGMVVTKQFKREGDVCPGVAMIAMAVERDDIIAPEVRAEIAESPALALFGLMRDIIELEMSMDNRRRWCGLFANC